MSTVADKQPASRRLSFAGLWRWLKQSLHVHREHAAAVAAIFVFTCIVFAPLFSGKTFSIVGAHMSVQYPWIATTPNDPGVSGLGYPQTDVAETMYPNSVFATQAFRSGQLPLWFPYSFSGIPLQELGLLTGWFYPPRVLAIFLMNPAHQHDFLLFTHLLMAGLGMYFLLRLWGANLSGAIFGAVVWELNGHNTFWLTLEHVAFTAAWLPLMLLAATLAVRKRSFHWAIAAGAATGLTLLTGSLHYVCLGGILLAIWYGVQAMMAARKQLRVGQRRTALLYVLLPVCSVIVALVLSAVCWLPLISQLSAVNRMPVTFAKQLEHALPFGELVRGMIWPRGLAGLAGQPVDAAGFVYTGVITIVLAFIAIGAAMARGLRRSAPIVLGFLTCLLTLGISLGFTALITVLRLVLPYFGTFKLTTGPYLFCFGMSVLAAFGMTEAFHLLARLKPTPGHYRWMLVAGGVLIVINAGQLIFYERAITPAQPERAELLFPKTPLISALQDMQGSHHLLPVYHHDPEGTWYPPVFAGKVAAIFNLRSSSGYESLLPLSTAALWRTVQQGEVVNQAFTDDSYRPYFYHDKLPMTLLGNLSVGLLVTPPDTVPGDIAGGDAIQSGAIQLVYQGKDGSIYKLNHALPRAFLVPQVVAAPDSLAALQMLVDQNFDARQAAIVIGDSTARQTGLPSSNAPVAVSGSSADITRDRLNHVEIDTQSPTQAMLVLNDSWASGWKAYVDGVAAPVLKVNYDFRGVVVPQGKHRVLFSYRPTMFMIGLGISSVTMFLLFVLFIRAGYALARRLSFSKPEPV